MCSRVASLRGAAGLLALLIVLTLAASAHADAWLLWEQVKYVHVPSMRQSTTWELYQAFDTSIACERTLPLVVSQQAEQWDRKRASGLDGVVSVRVPKEVLLRKFGVEYPDKGTIHTFKCLPDTVDPRK